MKDYSVNTTPRSWMPTTINHSDINHIDINHNDFKGRQTHRELSSSDETNLSQLQPISRKRGKVSHQTHWISGSVTNSDHKLLFKDLIPSQVMSSIPSKSTHLTDPLLNDSLKENTCFLSGADYPGHSDSSPHTLSGSYKEAISNETIKTLSERAFQQELPFVPCRVWTCKGDHYFHHYYDYSQLVKWIDHLSCVIQMMQH